MTTIAQDATPSKFGGNSTKSSVFDKEPKDEFFDDYSSSSNIYVSKWDRQLEMMGFEKIEPIESNTNISSMFSPVDKSPSKSHDQPPSYSSSTSANRNNSSSSGSKVTAGGTKYNSYENDEAQKKFGGAKAISSDQFFNNDASSFERSANLAKFQGSNSISSAEYFGDGPAASGRGGGGRSMCHFERINFY